MKSNIIAEALRLLGVPYTYHHTETLLSEEPFSNSLFGLSVILDQYGVKNRSVRFNDKNDLEADDIPLIAVYKGEFVIVSRITSDSVEIIGAEGKKSVVEKAEFIEGWSGVALLFEETEASREPDLRKHLRDQRASAVRKYGTILCIATAIVAAGTMFISQMHVVWYLLVTVNAAGLGIGWLLMKKKLKIPDRFSDKLCGMLGDSHCEDVTESEGADFLGLAGLAEIGFGYFFVNLCSLLFFGENACFWAGIIGLCALPFTLWSVWYQGVRLKKWCALCLSTLVILWIQACIYLIAGFEGFTVRNISVGVILCAAYPVAVAATHFIAATLLRAKDADYWKREYMKIKTDSKVIDSLREGIESFDTSATGCSSLIFGNPEASQRITIFSNPYCGPCAKMHERIDTYPGQKLAVQYVMTYFSEPQSIINRYIIAAYLSLGAERTWRMLGEWFAGGKKLGEEFFAPYRLDPYSPEVSAEFNKQKSWRNDKNLYGTPTVLIAGREIRTPYTVEDHPYLDA